MRVTRGRSHGCGPGSPAVTPHWGASTGVELAASQTNDPFRRIAEVYLFDTCTQKCGYCTLAETGRVLDFSQLEPYRDIKHIHRVTDFFNTRTTQREKWLVLLTGGEPLIMPNLEIFCGRLFEKGNSVAFYSGLSVGKRHRSFEFLLGCRPPDVDYIMASFHPESEPREDEYFEKIEMLKEAGHNVLVRFVGHPARLHQLERLSRRCEQLDVCFYPTTLCSRNYPKAYTRYQSEQLSRYFGSLSQVIQLEGGIDTRMSKCFAGSHIVGVYLDTGRVSPCISVSTPIIGNVYEDWLQPDRGLISCPEAGIACTCDVHFQQNIVIGAEDDGSFRRQKQGFAAYLTTSQLKRLVEERRLRFSEA